MSDTYRPQHGPPRRDSDNRSYRTDDYSAAHQGHLNDRIDRDRYRDSRPTSRPDREDLFPAPRRPASESSPGSGFPEAKMASDKAVSEIARLLRGKDEALVDKIKWTTRKDNGLAGFKKRHDFYTKQGGPASCEPSVVEAFEKHDAEYKKERDKIQLGLDKADAINKDFNSKFAGLLVQALPVNGVKERQVIDAVKAEVSKTAHTDAGPKLQKQIDDLLSKVENFKKESEVQATTNDRTQKLEQQMTSLLKSHEAQQISLIKLQKENEEMRARDTLYQAQIADITSLKTRQDQLELEARAVQDSQNWSQERDQLMSQVTELGKRLDLCQAEFSESLQDLQTKLNAVPVPAPVAEPVNTVSPQQLQALDTQFKELDKLVKQHDTTLCDFEADEYTGAMMKLLAYPSWADLNSRIQGSQKELQRISLETRGLTSAVARFNDTVTDMKRGADQTSDRLTGVKTELNGNMKRFSDGIVDACTKMINDATTKTEQLKSSMTAVENRIDSLETRAAISSRAPSAVANGNDLAVELEGVTTAARATDAPTQAVRDDMDRLRKQFTGLEEKVREFKDAHEMMIMGLDEQFKNLTTLDLANIILDNIKKLPTNIVPMDVQNFHERLVDLEAFKQQHTRRGKEAKAFLHALNEEVKSVADAVRPPKRQRLEEQKE